MALRGHACFTKGHMMSYRDPLYETGSTSDADAFDVPIRDASGSSGQGQGQEMADQVSQQGQQAMDTAKQKAGQMTDTAQQKAGELGSTAQQKADQGMDKAAQGLDQAAEKLRQQGQQGGTMGTAATKTADTLDSASQYLRDKDTDQLLSDLESLVRRKPVESVLVAAGVGFVLSKLFR